MPEVALFTHRFLEPTHVAIAQTLKGLSRYRYRVYAKSLMGGGAFHFPNLLSASVWASGVPEDLAAAPDLYHSIWDDKVSFRVLAIRQRYPAPYVVSLHGGRDGLSDPRYQARIAELFDAAERFTVVAESHRDRLLERGCHPAKIRVIRVGIDPELYTPCAEVADGPQICQVARFVDKKGVLLTIEVFRRIRERCPAAKLVLVGDGPLRGALESAIRRYGLHGACHLTGLLNHREMLRVLSTSHVYLHPAAMTADGDQEGTPMILLEAQALRVPVVTTNSGAITAVVEHGCGGLVAPEHDLERLASYAIRLAGDGLLRRQLGSRGRRFVLRHHRLSRTVADFDQLYSELLRPAPALAHAPER
jgi:glycosyltransferase involved in cell wall biosynthesis